MARKVLMSLTAAILVHPQEATAHHMIGGELPDSVLGGLLSGLAHPVIGAEHLAFILAVGIIAAKVVAGSNLPVIFLSASLAGCALRLTSVSIAGGEVLVAASVVAAGVLLAVDRKVRHSLLVVSLALAGVFHGFVYGESIAGTEPTSIVGYLLGLGVIQYALAMAAFVVTKRFSDRALPQRNVLMRTAGIAVGLVGMVSFALTI